MKYHAPYGSTDPDASYVDKNVPGAVRGSPVPAAAIEDPQRELVDFITKSGIVPADDLQLSRAVQSGKVNFVAATGTAAAITATMSPAPAALTNGLEVNLQLASALPGAATLNLNGLGAVPIKTPYRNDPVANDGRAGQLVRLVYSSDQFILQPADAPKHAVQVFNTAGTSTWTAPVTGWYWVEVYGGGGASANFTGSVEGEGGGGGGYAGEWLFFAAGDAVSVTVGAPGSFGGADGGTSSFGAFLSATGGGTATSAGVPGNGGIGTGGQINLQGQSGTDGRTAGQWAGFGGDAAGPNGGKGAVSDRTAIWPGGGGGLLSYQGSTIWIGNPAAGGVIVSY